MNSMKRRLILWVVMMIVMIAIAFPRITVFAEGVTTTITILHTNDIHTKVEPANKGRGSAKLVTLLKQNQNINPSNLILDAGEPIHGTSSLSEVIGETKVYLEGARELVQTGETNLGNLITDSMLAATGADMAITNGGGIRGSIAKGHITKGEVIKVLPFGYHVVTKKVTGEQIRAALEHGTSDYPALNGAFPHVAGITYELDKDAPAGSRVKNIMIKGKAIDLEKEYILATNDFMVAGGDGYTMLAGGELIAEYPSLDEILINYIKEKSPVQLYVQNRVVLTMPFLDVTANDWAYPYIKDLLDRKIVKGTSATAFSPSKELTRAELASLLVRAFDMKATQDAPFTDLGNLQEDMKQGVAAAFETGIIKGVSETTFEPNRVVTREEMLLMIKRTYEWVGNTQYKPKNIAPFKDLKKLSGESAEAITMGYELGLVHGFDEKTFNPQGTATREQIAKIISLMLHMKN